MIDLSTSFFFVIVFKIPKFICISLICQNQVSSFTYDFKHLSISISMFSKNIMFFVMVTLTIIVPWVSSNVNVQYFISISWSFSNNWFKLNILLFIVWDIINITNKLMTVIFHLNQNRTFFFMEIFEWFANVTLPLIDLSSFINLFLSPYMWLLAPLSRYHMFFSFYLFIMD
jgi:hypothetical protein